MDKIEKLFRRISQKDRISLLLLMKNVLEGKIK